MFNAVFFLLAGLVILFAPVPVPDDMRWWLAGVLFVFAIGSIFIKADRARRGL